jgi:DNA-formamidopyrimidine glycosylase
MPESAEVKLTTEFLSQAMTNRIITKWEFTSGQYLNSDPEGFDEFYESLPLLVEEVSCKGKFIYMKCFNEYKKFYILHSMRLTGSWRNEEDSSSRWYVELDKGRKIWFHDSRCLATLKFTTDEQELTRYLAKLGPDILTEDFTLAIWKKLVQDHKNKNITAFLMDQEIIAGIGNWLKAEILFYSKISPLRKVGSLTENESDQLFESIRIIPRQAYMNKGLSTRDYTDANGKKGFQEFHLKVYGKKHAKRTKTADGRTTYWDDKVQR